MNIAVIAWGSLIWCPGSLRIRTKWKRNGPNLPIEFARISKDGRLTLVIHLGTQPESPTYWALSEFDDLKTARENLRVREGKGTSIGSIHFISLNDSPTEENPTHKKIRDWLRTHGGIDAVIWTGLSSNWTEKRGGRFTSDDAVLYLGKLESERNHTHSVYERAQEYVRNAPESIQTEVRQRMQKKGWIDNRLPIILFEG